MTWKSRLRQAGRYKAAYVLGAAWLAMVLLVPTASVPRTASSSLGAKTAAGEEAASSSSDAGATASPTPPTLPGGSTVPATAAGGVTTSTIRPGGRGVAGPAPGAALGRRPT